MTTISLAGEYYDNVEAHEEYRRWHDRDCVLTGGCLEADTMFSLWLPLRHTIVRINDMEVIRQVGNIYSKYDFLRELIGGNNLQKLLPGIYADYSKTKHIICAWHGKRECIYTPGQTVKFPAGKKSLLGLCSGFFAGIFPGRRVCFLLE